MHLTGEQRIAAPRETVWAALNDAEVLQACIPGCEEIEKVSDTEMNAKVKAKVGPVAAKFQGSVTLSDLNPPESYRISGEGKGGAAGFAKGGATVNLAEDGDGTLLTYEVDAQVGGKLAQIGSRLIDGTAKKLAGDFFANLEEHVAQPAAEEAEDAAPQAEAAVAAAAAASHGAGAQAEHADDHGGHHGPPEPIDDPNVGAGVKTGVWVTGLIVVVILLLFIFGLGGGGGAPQ